MKELEKESKPLTVSGFDLANLNESEIRQMFLSVPVKSLNSWLSYYLSKEQYEICKVIKEVRNFRSTDQEEADGEDLSSI